MTVPSKRFTLRTLVPIWLVAVGIVAVFESPMTFATGVFLLMVGIVVPAVLILLISKDRSSTVAEVLNRVERPSTRS